MKKLNQMIGVCSLILMSACATVGLTPGAERVILSKKDAPKGCKFIGAVNSSNHGITTISQSSAQRAQNEMRNKGYAMGANYIQLESEYVSNSGASNYTTISTNGQVYVTQGSSSPDVSQAGNAYRCNPADIGLE